MTLDEVKKVCAGKFNIENARGYTDERLNLDDKYTIQYHTVRSNLLRLKLHSKFRSSATHYVWIEVNVDGNKINRYYCQCRGGARTLGCCSHVASIIWFMGYERHNTPNYQPRIFGEDILEITKATLSVDPELGESEDESDEDETVPTASSSKGTRERPAAKTGDRPRVLLRLNASKRSLQTNGNAPIEAEVPLLGEDVMSQEKVIEFSEEDGLSGDDDGLMDLSDGETIENEREEHREEGDETEGDDSDTREEGDDSEEDSSESEEDIPEYEKQSLGQKLGYLGPEGNWLRADIAEQREHSEEQGEESEEDAPEFEQQSLEQMLGYLDPEGNWQGGDTGARRRLGRARRRLRRATRRLRGSRK